MYHDKRYEDLDSLGDYKLEHKSQDIRGRPLVGPDGEQYGVIDDLLVDRDAGRVSAVRLEDGRVCAVEPLEIHDNVVVYGQAAVSHAKEGVKSGHVVEEERVPIVEERLAIGKRVADHGRNITVTTDVVSERVSEDVTVRDEDVTVERRAVNKTLTGAEADAALAKGGKTVTMTERDEEVVVAKDAVVTDEVVVKKTADDKTTRVDETVRKTVVDVDDNSKRR